MRLSFYAALLALLVSIAVIGYAYSIAAIGVYDATAWSSMALSLLFPVIVFSYLLSKGRKLREIVDGLGLSRRRMALRYVGLGLLLFVLFIFIELGAGAFSAATGIKLPTNVQAALAGMPVYFYVFSIIVAPIDEEILFRGFLVPRIGIVASAVIFGALHYISYFSIIEFVAALIFGLVAGYAFKRTGSLYPSMIGHVLINALGITAAFFA